MTFVTDNFIAFKMIAYAWQHDKVYATSQKGNVIVGITHIIVR